MREVSEAQERLPRPGGTFWSGVKLRPPPGSSVGILGRDEEGMGISSRVSMMVCPPIL